MKITFTQFGKRTKVRNDDLAGRETSIADMIRECRNNSRGCPSGECRNIESIEEFVHQGSITLTIVSPVGESLSSFGIEQCLRSMVE